MKATGIVRRIDDLGRVVIPKEIRRTMRIRVGDPLEIFTDHDGDVIFKKYSPVGEMGKSASDYCDALSKGTNKAVVICDRDHCIAASGISKSMVLERRVSAALEDVMEQRKPYALGAEQKEYNALEGIERPMCAAAPVIASSDVLGAVVLLTEENAAYPTETELKLLTVAAAYLGNSLSE